VTTGENEAFSRVLIDKTLEGSGWDLLNPQQVLFESNTANGRVDYLLKDSLGRILCVLEAKREGLDPYDAKEQARSIGSKGGFLRNAKTRNAERFDYSIELEQ
jgi:predicted type IV restriction endonuclease